MIGRVFRLLVGRGTEGLLAIALVLVFFLAFMGLLGMTFPQGTSLTDLMRSGSFTGERSAPVEADLRFGDEGSTPIALLSRLQRDVRDKPADAIAWSASRRGQRLGHYHSVQTFERSRATITFSESSEIVLDENSLVVLKSADRLPEGRARASLIVLDGTLRGRIAIGRHADVAIEVEAATEVARLRSIAAAGEPADFSVTVGDDRSSTFSVFSGAAEVISGKVIIAVAPDQAVTVDADGTPGPVVALPPAPRPIAPEDGARQRYRSTRTRVLFRWTAAENSDAWLITVARDPGFRDIVLSERVTTPTFTLGNLRAGRYVWRVRSLRGDLEGADGPTREFLVVRDRRPPDLTVNFPAAVVNDRAVALTGSTEPGVRVIVGGQETPVGETGDFAATIHLKQGANVVVVEAVDDAGNVAYRSQIINVRNQVTVRPKP